MKFGKLLKDLTEGNPQMNEQPLIRYKELKKHLKNIKKQQDAAAQQGGQQEEPAAAAVAVDSAPPQQQQQQAQQQQQSGLQEYSEEELGYQLGPELPTDLSAEEQAFINMLNEDLCRFNRFFMDKEEDAVIKLQALADRIAGAQGSENDAQELKAALVDFHGEMVLLLHWSLLNYAAVVKILKKHDKQSGLLLRAPYLANVLQQPFYSTSIMSRLVKMAEGHIESLVAQEARKHTAAAAAADADQQADGISQLSATAARGLVAVASAAAAAARTDRSSQLLDAQQQQAAAAAAAGAAPSAAAAAAAGGADAGSLEGSGPNAAMSDTDTAELLSGTAVCTRTRVALLTWQQLCTNASTPSTVLPANSSQALVRALNVRQRWAKIVSMAPIMQQAGMDAPAAAAATAAAAAAAAAVEEGAQEGTGQVQGADVADNQQEQQEQQEQTGTCVAGQKHRDDQAPAEVEAACKRQRLDS